MTVNPSLPQSKKSFGDELQLSVSEVGITVNVLCDFVDPMRFSAGMAHPRLQLIQHPHDLHATDSPNPVASKHLHCIDSMQLTSVWMNIPRFLHLQCSANTVLSVVSGQLIGKWGWSDSSFSPCVYSGFMQTAHVLLFWLVTVNADRNCWTAAFQWSLTSNSCIRDALESELFKQFYKFSAAHRTPQNLKSCAKKQLGVMTSFPGIIYVPPRSMMSIIWTKPRFRNLRPSHLEYATTNGILMLMG
jgi:hypothetical protein